MVKDFNEYLSKIKEEIVSIPKSNLLFFEMWFCEELYSTCDDILIKHFSKNEITLIQNIINYLWSIVDNNSIEDVKKTNSFLFSLQEMDETNLDQTNYKENALYQLIISLDSILRYCNSKRSGFDYFHPGSHPQYSTQVEARIKAIQEQYKIHGDKARAKADLEKMQQRLKNQLSPNGSTKPSKLNGYKHH